MLTRCARPRIGKLSTYTVLGFTGYVVASIVGAALSVHWGLSLTERILGMIVPPTVFILVVAIATAIAGRELIVFYQTTLIGVAVVTVAAWLLDANLWRVLDIAVIGYGVFLTFGRLGCFAVACCHGRPARHGVRYGDQHVALGLWRRMRHRPLLPVQLIESAVSLSLVVVGVALSRTPGTAAVMYAVGYSAIRFGLELLRGDPVRPFLLGLSEGQWSALVTAIVCAIAWPSELTIAVVAGLAACSAWLITRRRQRELTLLPHVRALDQACAQTLADATHARRDTPLGLGVSVHALADGRHDWVMSSTHPTWSGATARKLASSLWPRAEIIDGKTPGVVHVITESGW